MEPKRLFQRSAEVKLLIRRLQEAENEIVTYQELSNLIGFPVEGRTPALQSAMRIILHEDSVKFGVVRGEGVKRLDSIETIDVSEKLPSRIKRMAARVDNDLATVTYDELDQEQRARVNTLRATIGAMRLFTKRKTQSQIEAAVRHENNEIPTAKLLELFK
jgi:hypothetical protein